MRTFPRWVLASSVLMFVALGAGGAWVYRSQAAHLQREAEVQLQAFAELKVGQLAQWRAARLGDAAVLTANPYFVAGAARWLGTGRPADASPLLRQFRALQEHMGYGEVLLVDPGGRVRLSLRGRSDPLATETAEALTAALRARRPVLTDLHVTPGDPTPRLDVVTPLVVGADTAPTAIGAVILQSNVQQVLYPLIQSWPTPSPTAETLLVRRDGDAVLFLNELRHRKDTALRLRIPLDQAEVPAVMAVSGSPGVAHGRDYRGVAVWAVTRAVPDSPWVLVAKVDAAEALAPWRARAGLLLALLLSLAAAAAGGLGFAWQRRTAAHDRALAAAAAAQRTSEERYRTTLLSVGDGVITTDADGRVELLNPVAERLTGWPEAEARGTPLEAVFPIVNETTRQPVENPVRRVVREGLVVGLANHTVLLARDGIARPIADSGAPIRGADGAVTGVVLVFRDQTRERAAEATLQASEARYRSLFTHMQEGLAYCRMVFQEGRPHDFVYLDVNAAFAGLTGLTDVVGKPVTAVIPGIRESDPELFELYGRVVTTGIPAKCERYVTALQMWFAISVYRPHAEHFVVIFDVITERKRAEAALTQRTTQLEAVRAVGEEIARELDLPQLLRLVIARAAALTEAATGTIYLWDADHELLVPGAWQGLGDWQGTVRLRLGEAIAGTVAHTRQTLLVNDYRTSTYAHPLTLRHTGLTASLGEPLLFRDKLVGAITLGHEAGRTFAPRDEDILRLFATQAAIAIENARLHEAAVRRSAELEALLAASRSVLSGLDLQAILDRIVAEACRISGAPHVKVLLVDREARALRVGAARGSGHVPGELLPLDRGASGTVARTGQPLFSPHHLADPHNLYADRDAQLDIRTYLGLPIKRGEDVLGVLTFNTTTPKEYSPAEVACLSAFADQAAIALENARLFGAAVEHRDRLLALIHAIGPMTAGLELEATLGQIVSAAAAIAHCAHVRLLLVDAATQTLRIPVTHGLTAPVGPLPIGTGLSGIVAATGQTLYVADTQTDPRNLFPDFDRQVGLHTYLGLPIALRGHVLGVLTFRTTESRTYTSEEIEYYGLFAAQAAIAIENARLFADAQQAMEDIQRAQAELVRAGTLRGLGQMAAGIAHDLNNTLAAILGQVELQKLRTADPTVREGLALLEAAAVDGAHVVQRLLHFARPRGASRLEPCDLAAVVREAVGLTQPRWKDEPQGRGVTIHVAVALPPDLPPIQGYPPELREALTNLVFNAVDAMPHGGTLTLAAAAADPDGVTLTVQDTGIGMPPDVQAHLFEPFFTTKGTRGTGLGLAGVYGIMERHGGRIAVSSTLGQGTTFTLTFRRATDAAPAHPVAAPVPSAPRRVLVVDDEPAVRTTVAALLRTAGHTVCEAADGAAALRDLAAAAPDVVLTDLGMPEMNGWELARALKTAQPGLPVILLTGWQEQAPGEAEDRGAVDAILGKPVRLDALRRTIAEVTAHLRPGATPPEVSPAC